MARVVAVLATVWFASKASVASAESAPRKLSSYEIETVALVLRELGARLEEAPEGKTVEAIEVVTLDVIEPRDPAPAMLNWFHATTLKSVIRREVLLQEGAPYDAELAAETERNLRGFPQLSVVLLVPVEGKTEGGVRVVVITKDVWSLRVGWAPTFVNGKLTSLSLAPAENNLFGTTQTVMATVSLDANNYWLGGRYYVPRVGGSRIRASVGASVGFNCRTDRVEGAAGDFTYGQPLYSSFTRWSWQTAMAWSSSTVRGLVSREDQSICGNGVSGERRYAATALEREPTWPVRAEYQPAVLPTGIQVDPDDPLPVPGVPVRRTGLYQQTQLVFPDQYRYERLRGQFVLTRSFHQQNKVNVSTGVEVDQRAYSREPVEFEAVARQRVHFEGYPDGRVVRVGVEPLPPDQGDFERTHRAYLDVSAFSPRDRRISPYAQLHAYSNTYLRVINYHTLGLQEDIQVGHDVYLRLYPAFEPLSTRDLLGVFASAAYTGHYRGGFARVLASSSVEYAGPRRSEAEVRGAGQLVTPDFGLGRIVLDAGFTHQPLQYFSGVYALGGTGRLRGYSPTRLLGPGVATVNEEFRSRPLRLFSVLAGIALFHDMGTVFGAGLDGFRLRHGAGIGLRVLAPQLDRDVFRIDFGFPLQDDPAGEFTFVASFGQAFWLPFSAPPVLLPQ